MKRKTKNTLRAMAKLFGLQIVFVSYFPADIHGQLLPREKRILINAYQPRCEHIFTLLHELGHYLQHVLTPCRTFHPRIFDPPFKNNFLARVTTRVRRYYRFAFNNARGKEWEADLWAMCAFLHLARVIGCRKELLAFVHRHPEKRNILLLAACGTIYCRVKANCRAFPNGFCFHLASLFGDMARVVAAITEVRTGRNRVKGSPMSFPR